VVPQTIVGFFFFLLLVAPGVSYELFRERRSPRLDQTAFREVSRVALYSFWFSFSACVIIVLLRILFPTALFDPAAYSHDSKSYLNSHYIAITWTVILEVLIAFVLVIVVDQISRGKYLSKSYAKLPLAVRKLISTDIKKQGLWFDIFEDSVPKNTIAWLSIRLTDGTRIAGYFYGCTVYDEDFKDTEIAVKKPATGQGWMALRDTQDLDAKSELVGVDVVWVRGEEISYIKVEYRPIFHPGV